MFEIRFIGWREGLRKVKLIKLIRDDAHLPLDEALRIVDRILDDEPVSVRTASLEDAHHLAIESEKLGVEITEIILVGE